MYTSFKTVGIFPSRSFQGFCSVNYGCLSAILQAGRLRNVNRERRSNSKSKTETVYNIVQEVGSGKNLIPLAALSKTFINYITGRFSHEIWKNVIRSAEIKMPSYYDNMKFYLNCIKESGEVVRDELLLRVEASFKNVVTMLNVNGCVPEVVLGKDLTKIKLEEVDNLVRCDLVNYDLFEKKRLHSCNDNYLQKTDLKNDPTDEYVESEITLPKMSQCVHGLNRAVIFRNILLEKRKQERLKKGSRNSSKWTTITDGDAKSGLDKKAMRRALFADAPRQRGMMHEDKGKGKSVISERTTRDEEEEESDYDRGEYISSDDEESDSDSELNRARDEFGNAKK